MSLLLRVLLVFTLSLLSAPFTSAVCDKDPPIDDDVAALREALPLLVVSNGTVTSWNATYITEACCWDGVVCNQIDGKQRVTWISFSGFSGNLPPSFGNLTSLTYLGLNDNSLTGNLPESWGNLSNLTALHLVDSRASGHLPESWKYLKNLETLDFSNNHGLTGSLPESWGNLTNMKRLDLSGNSFTGELPESWGSLTNLEYLDLRYNSLTGNLPESWGYLEELTYVEMCCNLFTGNLSESWGNLKKLVYLTLYRNRLTENLSNSWGYLTALSHLDLGENILTGNLPESWANLTALTFLDLSYNSLTGNLPDSWVGLSNLNELRMQGNSLTGYLPESWANLTALTFLDLSYNNLTGNLPEFWRNLTHLASLDLSGNSLTGNLPESWGNLTYLTSLALSGNSLTGSLPDNWRKLTSLTNLVLSFNQLNGSVNVVENMTHLEYLYLNDNQFTGKMDAISFSNLKYLICVDIHDNNFTGSFPVSIGTLNLTYLWLGGNPDMSSSELSSADISWPVTLKNVSFSSMNLIGSIPEAIIALPNLLHIDLSHNSLSGGIPAGGILESPSIEKFDLSWNMLSGEIPIKFVNASSNLTELNLSENKLFGGIPLLLLSASKLQSLNLRGNRFNTFLGSIYDVAISQNLRILNLGSNSLEEIPDWVSSYTRLQEVYFDNNKITGGLPSYLGNFSYLQVLDLSNNSFYSQIPDTFGAVDVVYDGLLELYRYSSFAGLSYLNLSLCNLNGSISDNFGKLQRLKILDLSNNDLTGNLPDFQDSDLHTLDLSNNLLSGELPESLGKLPPEFLNFNNNSLTGRVPDYYFKNSLAKCSHFFPGNSLSASCVSDLVVNFNFPPPYPPPSPPPSSPIKGLPEYIIPTTVVGSVLLILVASFAAYFCIFKKKSVDSITKNINEQTVKFVPLHVIIEATDNFSESNVLGVGGFGIVCKGISKNGDVWAVKRAKKASVESLELFKNEVETISRMNHKNLVKLIGFFHSESEQIMVYEFIENGTLKSALKRQEGTSQPVLTLEQRLDIALGAAEGLRYLHTQAKPTIIHRDVKSENILLDANMRAKVCDFGLLKDNEDQEELAKRTSVAGTYGYMDPEYYTTFKVTTKSDVYSFGVVLLELITGQPAVFEETPSSSDYERTSLSNWALKMMRSTLGLSAIVDPSLESDYSLDDMNALASIAASCLQKRSMYRPEMADVASHLRILKTKMENKDLQVIENNGVTLLPTEDGVEEGPIIPILNTTSSSKNISYSNTARSSTFKTFQQQSVLLPR